MIYIILTLEVIALYFVVRNRYVAKERARVLDHIYLHAQKDSYLNLLNYVSYPYMLFAKWYVWPIKRLWPDSFKVFDR